MSKKIEDKWRFVFVSLVFLVFALGCFLFYSIGAPFILHVIFCCTMYLFVGCLISLVLVGPYTTMKAHRRVIFTWLPLFFSERVRKWTVGESI
jgi:hypothetical protein